MVFYLKRLIDTLPAFCLLGCRLLPSLFSNSNIKYIPIMENCKKQKSRPRKTSGVDSFSRHLSGGVGRAHGGNGVKVWAFLGPRWELGGPEHHSQVAVVLGEAGPLSLWWFLTPKAPRESADFLTKSEGQDSARQCCVLALWVAGCPGLEKGAAKCPRSRWGSGQLSEEAVLPVLHLILLVTLLEIIDPTVSVYFWTFYAVPWIHTCTRGPIAHWLAYFSFIVSLEIRECDSIL